LGGKLCWKAENEGGNFVREKVKLLRGKNPTQKQMQILHAKIYHWDPPCSGSSDTEAEAEAPEAVDLWWKRKRKRLKICRFCFRSVSKVMFKFW
jgi:hypothetical protein